MQAQEVRQTEQVAQVQAQKEEEVEAQVALIISADTVAQAIEDGAEDLTAELEQVDARELELERLRKLVDDELRVVRQRDKLLRDYPCPAFLKEHETKINVAITGGSGVGKSQFVNALLGTESCVVGEYGEQTMDPAPHELKAFKLRECLIWDLPGAGTDNFPADTYIKTMGLRYFDVILFMFDIRVRESDSKMLQELFQADMPFMVVRTKIDSTIGARQMRVPDAKPEETVASAKSELLRSKCGTFPIPFIYAVSTFHLDRFDFKQLMNDLVATLVVRRSSKLKSDRECIVCLEEFGSGKARKAFGSCGHLFCQTCDQRLKICPLCRSGRADL